MKNKDEYDLKIDRTTKKKSWRKIIVLRITKIVSCSIVALLTLLFLQKNFLANKRKEAYYQQLEKITNENYQNIDLDRDEWKTLVNMFDSFVENSWEEKSNDLFLEEKKEDYKFDGESAKELLAKLKKVFEEEEEKNQKAGEKDKFKVFETRYKLEYLNETKNWRKLEKIWREKNFEDFLILKANSTLKKITSKLPEKFLFRKIVEFTIGVLLINIVLKKIVEWSVSNAIKTFYEKNDKLENLGIETEKLVSELAVFYYWSNVLSIFGMPEIIEKTNTFLISVIISAYNAIDTSFIEIWEVWSEKASVELFFSKLLKNFLLEILILFFNLLLWQKIMGRGEGKVFLVSSFVSKKLFLEKFIRKIAYYSWNSMKKILNLEILSLKNSQYNEYKID